MQTPAIPPPQNVPDEPDRYTREGMPDYTGSQAGHRVLFINLGFFKYGTHDRTHAAAFVFATLLLVGALAVAVSGFFMGTDDAAWAEKVFTWVGGAFLFVAGVAIGKGGSERPPSKRDED